MSGQYGPSAASCGPLSTTSLATTRIMTGVITVAGSPQDRTAAQPTSAGRVRAVPARRLYPAGRARHRSLDAVELVVDILLGGVLVAAGGVSLGRSGLAACRNRVTHAPPSARFAAAARPPCASAVARTMARPSPAP
jgi:hypothetical protein